MKRVLLAAIRQKHLITHNTCTPFIFIHNLQSRSLITDSENLMGGDVYFTELPKTQKQFEKEVNRIIKSKNFDRYYTLLRDVKKKMPFDFDVVYYNAKLKVHRIEGNPERGEKILEKMMKYGVQPNAETFFQLCSAYVNCSQFENALQVIPRMRKLGITPTKDIYIFLLNTFSKNRSPLFEDVMEQLKVDNIHDKILTTVIMKGYGSQGKLDKVKEWFEKIETEDLDADMYASLIDVLIMNNKIEKAEEIIRKMQSQQINPSMHSFSPLLKYYIIHKDISKVNQLCDEVRKLELAPNEEFYKLMIRHHGIHNELDKVSQYYEEGKSIGKIGRKVFHEMILAFIRNRKMKEAFSILDEMKERNVEPDLPIFKELMRGFLWNNQPQKALEVYYLMKDEYKIIPNNQIFLYLVDAYAALKKDVAKVLYEAKKFNIAINDIVMANILEKMCRLNRVDQAAILFGRLNEYNIEPTIFMYNTFIYHYNNTGRSEDATFYFNKMKQFGLKPNEHTYSSVILGYFRKNQTDKILETINEMKKQNIEIENKAYNYYLKSLLKNSMDINEAIERVQSLGYKIDDHGYSGIIGHLISIGNLEEAVRYLKVKESKFPLARRDYSLLIFGFCQQRNIEEAIQYYEKFKSFPGKLGHKDHDVFSVLVRTLMDSGDLEKAKEVAKDAQEFGCKEDIMKVIREYFTK